MRINKQEILKFLNAVFIKIRPVLLGILAFFVLYLVYGAYKYFLGYHIMAEFKELGPIRQSMPVYYKGFQVGRTGIISPNKDYSSSSVRIILNRNLGHLPGNIIAKVKKFEQEPGSEKTPKNYIDLMYPDAPAKVFIKRGSIIEGKTAVDIQSFMSSQAESGTLTIISDNMGKVLDSAEKTSDELRALTADIRVILQENRASLNEISKNLAVATKGISDTTVSLGEVTKKLNNSTNEAQLTNIMNNIEETTKNINSASENINSTTENIDKATKNLDKTMSEVDAAMGNVNQITGGAKSTLSKRFGTIRFIFGTPLREP